jgi:hypothetical protein
MVSAEDIVPRIVYWHRELPPADAEVLGEGVIEATSGHILGTLAHRDELWQQRYGELMAHARTRMEQEVRRLGGAYAHVLSESVDTRRNDASGEAWLHGTFSYVLLGVPKRQTPRTHDCPDGGCQDKAGGCAESGYMSVERGSSETERA